MVVEVFEKSLLDEVGELRALLEGVDREPLRGFRAEVYGFAYTFEPRSLSLDNRGRVNGRTSRGHAREDTTNRSGLSMTSEVWTFRRSDIQTSHLQNKSPGKSD